MRSFRTAFSYLFSQTSCALASEGLLPVAAHPAEATFGLRRWHVASSVKKSYSSQRVICRASLAYCEQINGQVRNCAPNLISTDLFTSSVVYCREKNIFDKKFTGLTYLVELDCGLIDRFRLDSGVEVAEKIIDL